MMNSVTTIDLLRHGECAGGQCYRGRSDVALTEQGWRQMQYSLTRVKPVWQRIISSPLIRCADFAHHVAQQRQLPLRLENDLQELNFGEWEGQPVDQVWQNQRAAVIAWGNNPVAAPPPQGEAADQFAERVTAVLLALLEHYRGEHLLLVCHGGVIRVLLAYCLAMPLPAMNRLEVPYACLSRLRVVYDQGEYYFRLLAHNLNHENKPS